VCAAALAVLRTVEEEGLLDASVQLGDRLRSGIASLRHPLVAEVRGLGLWLGIVLAEPVAAAAERCARDAGFLINAAAPDVLRLAPPLVVSTAQLDAAQPWLPLYRRLTSPAGRRYLAGWTTETELHVLAPRLLARRASNVEGSVELLMLAPAALFARRLVGASNPRLPPPFGVRSFRRYLHWAWLVEGAAQYFSGQAAHVRPAVTRRMREGSAPAFPPAVRDAALLGGTLFDLLAREEGEAAAVALATAAHHERPEDAIVAAFNGRPLRHTEGTWRAHLERLAGGGEPVVRREARAPLRPPSRR
ncbi:MAG: aminotransferase class III-fold pyridoxal phosphate-dependent enzyme, partial [Actinobacteria bacterium]|nr:aminotransferase class III-fold pyridoxal phosphate-dependent enzyme [Actinomycetota bacterium]